MKRLNSNQSRKRRMLWLMLPVVLPGLLISGLGIRSVSQQKRVKELQLQEKYTQGLKKIGLEIEKEILRNVEEAFRYFSSQTINQHSPTSIQQLLKDILLKHPMIKYPFIINSSGSFIFPFSRKSSAPVDRPPLPGFKNRQVKINYEAGEKLELKERAFGEALKLYLKCLAFKTTVRVKSTIYNAIARCYFKTGKYSQAISYYRDILEMNTAGSAKEKNYFFYFSTLRQLAQSYQRMGNRQSAIFFYLRLYEELLQLESSKSSELFTFYKNEALDHLNRQIPGTSGENARFLQAKSRDRLQQLSDLDIALRWRYYEYQEGNILDAEDSRPSQQEKDVLRFARIREFYLGSGEKNQFYRSIKPYIKADEQITEIEIKTLILWGSKKKVEIAVSNLNGGLKVGFMLAPEVLNKKSFREILLGELGEPGLQLIFSEAAVKVAPEESKLYLLGSHRFATFFKGKRLGLYASGSDHISQQVRREIQLSYMFISAFILVLIMGILLFYKYLSREADILRLKSEFTDNASHTLKTPLTRIRMLTEKLQLGWINKESKKQDYFQTILSETDRMSDMITNMLDFSKIDAGKKQYNLQPASIHKAVKKGLDSYSQYIRSMGFQLHAHLDETIPHFPIDSQAITLLVVNLLQNAVKYSNRQKKIKLTLSKAKKYILLEVEDKGIGIEPRELKNIFRRFYRVTENRIQSIEGSGLGLYLVQHAVEAHNGEISVTSSPGEGSCFSIRIPC